MNKLVLPSARKQRPLILINRTRLSKPPNVFRRGLLTMGKKGKGKRVPSENNTPITSQVAGEQPSKHSGPASDASVAEALRETAAAPQQASPKANHTTPEGSAEGAQQTPTWKASLATSMAPSNYPSQHPPTSNGYYPAYPYGYSAGGVWYGYTNQQPYYNSYGPAYAAHAYGQSQGSSRQVPLPPGVPFQGGGVPLPQGSPPILQSQQLYPQQQQPPWPNHYAWRDPRSAGPASWNAQQAVPGQFSAMPSGQLQSRSPSNNGANGLHQAVRNGKLLAAANAWGDISTLAGTSPNDSLRNSTSPGSSNLRKNGGVRPKQPSPTVAYLSPKQPQPTAAYLSQAAKPPQPAPLRQPLLIVIDLNGTLVFRSKNNRTNVIERPYLRPFLDYILKKHSVMIWSSATPPSVDLMCGRIFTPDQRKQLIAEWARDTLGLTKVQYQNKVQVYKQLTRVWQDPVIASTYFGSSGCWDQSNTVLLDDSKLKASSEPHNLIEIPEFENTPEQRKSDYLGKVLAYVEELSYQEDVSAFMREQPFNPEEWRCDWGQELVNAETERELNGQWNADLTLR